MSRRPNTGECALIAIFRPRSYRNSPNSKEHTLRLPTFLGNDIVHWSGPDAREKRPESAHSKRFLDRILDSGEHTQHDRLMSLCDGLDLTAAHNRDEAALWSRALWALWAAKEATYKAAVKAVPGLGFSPRSIVVTVDPEPYETGASGLVHSYADLQVGEARPLARGRAVIGRQWYDIVWEACGEFVHTVSVGPFNLSGNLPFDAKEIASLWDGIVHASALHDTILCGIAGASQSIRNATERASSAVRRLACNLARTVPGLHLAALEVRRATGTGTRNGAPVLFDQGHRKALYDIDLSLSHDGPWSAAAVLNRSPVRP
ncbi:MAG: 4-phosphopantetheinyl transferase family protein [Spirochaetaceae bacterium]|nr:MAG: 4-phosphopantetheinyl transferase family protein [Spirochaetaceae bacterium]